MSEAPIVIDGSMGEGGGQVVRTALALGARTETPVRVDNIRANRPKPGLRPQHLAAAQAIAMVCDGELEGASVGSTSVQLRPGRLKRTTVSLETGTAASTTLVLHALVALAPALPGPVILDVAGGTDTRWAPTVGHARDVFAPLAARCGVQLVFERVEHGFYPVGGGRLRVRIEPGGPIGQLDLEDRGELEGIEVLVRVADLPDRVAERVSTSCARTIQAAGYEVRRRTERVDAPSAGVVVDAIARFEHTVLGANALGERGVPSEAVGRACGGALLAELGSRSTLDVHAADQIVPLHPGGARTTYVVREVSRHLRTNLDVCRRLLSTSGVIENLGPDAHGVRLA